jgi:hypothetical protein
MLSEFSSLRLDSRATSNELALARELLTQGAMVLHRRIPLILALIGLIHDSGVARADGVDDARPRSRRYRVPPPPPVSLTDAPPYPTTSVRQRIALSGPTQIIATDDHGPPPAGYTTMLRKRKGLIIAGSIMVGAAYLECALVAAFFELGGSKHERALWIPVAGPFVQLARTNDSTANLLLLGVGGVQAVGAVLLSYGLTTRRRVFVRNDLVRSVTVAPIVGDGASGVVLSGRF